MPDGRSNESATWEKLVKYNENGTQNMAAQNVGEDISTLHTDINFSWDKTLCTECCCRKERRGITWLLAECISSK